MTDNATPGSAKNRNKEFTRQELYDLVWATHIVKFAREFGLAESAPQEVLAVD